MEGLDAEEAKNLTLSKQEYFGNVCGTFPGLDHIILPDLVNIQSVISQEKAVFLIFKRLL